MDINGGDKNGIFLHDLVKITEGTVSEGTIFMHIFKTTNGYDIKNVLILNFTQVFFYYHFFRYQGRRLKLESCSDAKSLFMKFAASYLHTFSWLIRFTER